MQKKFLAFFFSLDRSYFQFPAEKKQVLYEE